MVDAHYTLGNLCPSAADGESLIQAFPDLIFINREDGTYLSCQASDRSQLYVQPEFFLNRRVQDVLPEEVASRFLNAFQDARNSRGVKEFAYCLEIGGMPQAFEARVAPCASDTFISIVRNITDHKAAEDAIRKSEMTLKAILSSTADGLLAIDQDRRILHFNERFVTIWKIPSSLLRTREDSLLLNHVLDQLKDPEAFLAKVEALYQCDQEDRDILRFKDGRTIERYSLPMVMDGRISGRVWSFRDITDRVRTEIERVELERHRQLIQRAESLSRMAGSVAHHFNNKLHTILGTLEVLSRFDSPREIEGHLSTAKIATQQAAEISRQLATYVGQPLDRKVPFDLNEVVEGYLGTRIESFPARVKLERVFTPERVSVEINLERFYQALANLISNAIDSFGPASGVLRIETGACSGEAISGNVQRPIGWDPGQGRYGFISIIDSGCGIPSVSMESVCDPFFSTKAVGRGLGLPVVLGIAQAHGGGITFSSEEHGVPKFRFTSPFSKRHQRFSVRPQGLPMVLNGMPRTQFYWSTTMNSSSWPLAPCWRNWASRSSQRRAASRH